MRMFDPSVFKGVFYAHRGLYDNNAGIPENSLPAFRAAAEKGYGVELDVQLSSDGYVVVFHDDTLDRVCGVHGNVADYPLAELQQMKLLDTEEVMPLFTDVLDVLSRGAGPLIVELKYAPNWKPLSEKTRQMLAAYSGPACIESFHPSIVRYFRQEDPERVRGQLAQAARAYGSSTPKLYAFAVSRVLTNVATRPDFIAYGLGPKPVSARLCGWLGAMKVCWTARGAENHARRMKENDAVIFEHYRP